MAIFVIANRRAGKFNDPEKKASRNTLDKTFSGLEHRVKIIHDYQPPDPLRRRIIVFEAETAEIAAIACGLPEDVLLEPEMLHCTPATVFPADLANLQCAKVADPFQVGTGIDLRVEVKGNGKALVYTEVILVLQTWGRIQRILVDETDVRGHVHFSYAWYFKPITLIVIPPEGYWSVLIQGPSDPVMVDCPPLPMDGPLAWWHEALGITTNDGQRGRGIRIGVVDSGVGPHPCLDHVTSIGAFTDGEFDSSKGSDSGSHGTHVLGIIGARPVSTGDYAGIAPAAELYSARVLPSNSGANQGDIAMAIDELSKARHVDLINMSLVANQPSEIVLDAIRDALERGTLCLCAAGNNSSDVNYPAAFSETVAVSALGLLGWPPEGTLAARRLPVQPDKKADEGLYLADFSSYGPAINCAGPGVGYISTVPARHGLTAPYASMDGTTVASAAVCGALAVLLSQDDDYQKMPREKVRGEMARSILCRSCRDVNLAVDYQGRGVPDAFC